MVTAPAWADLRKEVEPNDSPASARPMVVPFSAGGTIGFPGDVDRFAVEVEAGRTIQADVLARGFRAGSQPGSELGGVVQILDRDGVTLLAQDQTEGEFDDPTALATVASAGRYYVAVRDQNPAVGGPAYSYVLAVEVEGDDAPAAAAPLDPPVVPSIDALIHPAGDQDYYLVEGAAGQVLTLDIDSAVFNPSQPPAKIVLSLLDPNGIVHAEDAYTAADPVDPQIQASLSVAGSWVIRVKELRAFVGTTNTYYQLSVRLGPAPGDEQFFEGTPVPVPRAMSGVVSPTTDVDHYRFDLASPGVLRADLDATEGLRSLLNGTLAIHDASGRLAMDSSDPDPALSVGVPAGALSASVEGRCAGPGCLAEDSYYVLYLDPDADGDGLVMPLDNCPGVANAGQGDGDTDGVGDHCDNCPTHFNPGQRDGDADRRGDACDCDDLVEAAADLTWLDVSTLSWSPTQGFDAYSVYRGSLLGGPFVYDHACLWKDFSGTLFTDGETPLPSTGFYHLVAGRDRCGEERGLGSDSSGTPRPIPSPCP